MKLYSMKLLTKQIINNFSKYPLYSQSGVEPKVIIAKFFGGSACTWYITEASKEGDDYRMFGWCDLGLGYPEWGYVMLSEIASIKFPPFGLPAERDRSFDTMRYTINQNGEVKQRFSNPSPSPTTITVVKIDEQAEETKFTYSNCITLRDALITTVMSDALHVSLTSMLSDSIRNGIDAQIVETNNHLMWINPNKNINYLIKTAA